MHASMSWSRQTDLDFRVYGVGLKAWGCGLRLRRASRRTGPCKCCPLLLTSQGRMTCLPRPRSYASRRPAPARVLPMPLTPITSLCPRQQFMSAGALGPLRTHDSSGWERARRAGGCKPPPYSVFGHTWDCGACHIGGDGSAHMHRTGAERGARARAARHAGAQEVLPQNSSASEGDDFD